MIVINEEVVHSIVGEHVLPERNGATFADDDINISPNRPEPFAKFLSVADGRGQRSNGDRLVQVDDDFFPDSPAEPIGQIVNLVHDHMREPVQCVAVGVKHVAQNLGGHDHDGRFAIHGVIAGQQPNVLGAISS